MALVMPGVPHVPVSFPRDCPGPSAQACNRVLVSSASLTHTTPTQAPRRQPECSAGPLSWRLRLGCRHLKRPRMGLNKFAGWVRGWHGDHGQRYVGNRRGRITSALPPPARLDATRAAGGGHNLIHKAYNGKPVPPELQGPDYITYAGVTIKKEFHAFDYYLSQAFGAAAT